MTHITMSEGITTGSSSVRMNPFHQMRAVAHIQATCLLAHKQTLATAVKILLNSLVQLPVMFFFPWQKH